jgi:hypothetical protein
MPDWPCRRCAPWVGHATTPAKTTLDLMAAIPYLGHQDVGLLGDQE